MGSGEGRLSERHGCERAVERERTTRLTLADRQLSRKMTNVLLDERDRRSAEPPEQPADSEEQPERGPRVTADGTVEELVQWVATLERERKVWVALNDVDIV